MCPLYKDAPANLAKLAYINARASVYLDTFLVNKESKNNEKYKVLCLQGQ